MALTGKASQKKNQTASDIAVRYQRIKIYLKCVDTVCAYNNMQMRVFYKHVCMATLRRIMCVYVCITWATLCSDNGFSSAWKKKQYKIIVWRKRKNAKLVQDIADNTHIQKEGTAHTITVFIRLKYEGMCCLVFSGLGCLLLVKCWL